MSKVKNTSDKHVILSVDLGLSLAPREVMELKGDLLRDALEVDGVVEVKDEVKSSEAKKEKKEE